jgi:hypothetical protein
MKPNTLIKPKKYTRAYWKLIMLIWMIYFREIPPKKQLHTTLKVILKNIGHIRSIPIDKRTYDF